MIKNSLSAVAALAAFVTLLAFFVVNLWESHSLPHEGVEGSHVDANDYIIGSIQMGSAPMRFTNWSTMSQSDRLDIVTQCMYQKELPADELAFLRAQLSDRSLMAVTRNNIANALCWQRHPDPYLHRDFITFINDPEESDVWREYSVQFLTEVMPTTAEPEVVAQTLRDLLNGPLADGAGLTGTAAIHIAILADRGLMTAPENFHHTLGTALDSPKVTPRAKMALIGVLGKRGDTFFRSQIRAYARQTDHAGLRRVAIAALGQMPHPQERDRQLVAQALQDENRAVVMAAEGAQRRWQ